MFVIRTILNGRVKINGNWFYPKGEPKYDGRLDGIAYAFGLYGKSNGEYKDFIHCWGTASYYYAWNEWGENIPTPHIEKNGNVLWSFWETKKKDLK
jgi:hypothetical protein